MRTFCYIRLVDGDYITSVNTYRKTFRCEKDIAPLIFKMRHAKYFLHILNCNGIAAEIVIRQELIWKLEER